MTSFTVSLTQNDWDKILGGWRCPVLRIPGAEANKLYAGGAQLDEAWYRIEPSQQLVRWARESDAPKSAALAVTLTKELIAEEKRDFWKNLALFAPVIAALLSAIGTYAAATATAKAKAQTLDPPGQVASSPPPTAPGADQPRDAYERWTVVGQVRVEDSSPFSVYAMVQPPMIPVRETGRFEANIPVLNSGSGDLEFPTLTFVPRQPGHKPTSIDLGDDRAELAGPRAAASMPKSAQAHSSNASSHQQLPGAGAGQGSSYQTPDYRLKIDFARRRIEVRNLVVVERDRSTYDPQAAKASQPPTTPSGTLRQ